MSKWVFPVVAGSMTLALGLFGIAVAVPSMTPLSHNEQPPVVIAPRPSVIKGSPVPAIAAADTIIAALPESMGGLPEAAVAESRPVSNNCVTPVVSRTRAWSGGSWLRPSGVVITVSVYPAGMGETAERCSPGRTVRRGDIIASVENTRASIDVNVVRRAMDSGTSQCADPGYTPDQSSRNPMSPNFIGLVRSIEVTYDGPTPRLVDDLKPVSVDVPSTPTFPHAPESLPPMPTKPDKVVAPTSPDLTTSFDARVPDPTGPGCGWAFTGFTPPTYDESTLNKTIADTTAEKQAELHSAVTAYNAQLGTYDAAKANFDLLNPAWSKWAGEVSAIADKWRQQGRDWNRYVNAKETYDAAVKARKQFYIDRQTAQETYDQQMQQCQVMVTPPPVQVTIYPTPSPTPTIDPTPTPTAEPTVAPTPPQPTPPQPTPSVTTSQPPPYPQVPCPKRPAILDQQPPHVPTEPTPPRPS